MVLPEGGVGLPEGAAMDWAHLQNVQSSFALRLQREARREVLVEREEHDNVDERARVLREVNRFTSNRQFRTDIARRLVTGEFRRPDGSIGTMILEPKPDALAPFALDLAELLKARGQNDELSPRSASGKKEALRHTVLMRRAEMAREFPHLVEWRDGVVAADTASSDELSSEEDVECRSGADESPEPNLPSGDSPDLAELEEPTSPSLDEELAEDGAERQRAPSVPLPPSTPEKEAAEARDVQETPQSSIAIRSGPRPTTSGEQSSPGFATPSERPSTVAVGRRVAELGGLLSPSPPAVLSPWHLDSLANRSRKGLSTQLSDECLPIVMGVKDTTSGGFTLSASTPPRAVDHPHRSTDANRSHVVARRQVPRLQRMSQLQQLRQEAERTGAAPQNSPGRRLTMPHANSLADSSPGTTSVIANASSDGSLQDRTTQDMPLQFSGMDMLAAARSSSGSCSSRGSRVIHGTQPRPPISPRHLAISDVRVSVSARPSARFAVVSNGDPHGVRSEASLSSLLSQSSRRLAQTHRFSVTGNAVNLEISQSSFMRIQKRGGMAKTVPDRRGAFGGGFSTGACTRVGGTPVSIRKGRPPAVTPSGFQMTVSLQSG
jgi:hypothetical protein